MPNGSFRTISRRRRRKSSANSKSKSRSSRNIDQRNVRIAGPGACREILDELFEVLGGRFPLVGGQLEIGGMIKHSAA